MVVVIAAIVIVLFFLLALAKTIRVIPQARAGVVERLGRYSRTLTPGLTLVVPFIDRVKPLLDLREALPSVEAEHEAGEPARSGLQHSLAQRQPRLPCGCEPYHAVACGGADKRLAITLGLRREPCHDERSTGEAGRGNNQNQHSVTP